MGGRPGRENKKKCVAILIPRPRQRAHYIYARTCTRAYTYTYRARARARIYPPTRCPLSWPIGTALALKRSRNRNANVCATRGAIINSPAIPTRAARRGASPGERISAILFANYPRPARRAYSFAKHVRHVPPLPPPSYLSDCSRLRRERLRERLFGETRPRFSSRIDKAWNQSSRLSAFLYAICLQRILSKALDYRLRYNAVITVQWIL